jgi:hypothetical protein
MRTRAFAISAVLICFGISTLNAPAARASAAGEYEKHFDALAKLSMAVAQAMPADKYGFKPHPESITFGELMSHIAATNYQFYAGLKDTNPPGLPPPAGREGVIEFLSDSFAYCLAIISSATEQQMASVHRGPGQTTAWGSR